MYRLITRYTTFYIVLIAATIFSILALNGNLGWWIVALPLIALTIMGIIDLTQTRHAIRRNYPIIGNLRFLFEFIRPEIRQYFMESDEQQLPFSRADRSLVYQRAKQQQDKQPFGTQLDLYGSGYEWINHSMAPSHITDSDFRITVGGPDCTQPYSLSVFNISAMSFGALSANAIMALNRGAVLGNFTHDTGEGGISRYHTKYGGCRFNLSTQHSLLLAV